MTARRDIVLKLNQADCELLWFALDVVEDNYRGAAFNLKRGKESKFTGTLESATKGIKDSYNMKQRVMRGMIQSPDFKLRP